jgi:DNA-binding winged helix-turn-helix (wHTH) protein/TolB-like protein
MTLPITSKLRIGEWCIDPVAGQIARGGEVVRVEARTMGLLLDLARHRGEVVSMDDLLDRVWSGVTVTQDSVYQAVTSLRRTLGDDPKNPTYIATVPRLGYRLVATVEPWVDKVAGPQPVRDMRRRPFLAIGALCVALLAAFLAYGQLMRAGGAAPAAPSPVTSVGVLPLLDMTETMDQQALTDDTTEALIDRLSKNPALRIPGPRTSFSLRGKHLPMAEAAKALGVTYLVDGSVHTAGARVWFAARLIRADTGFVVWSQTYDQPSGGGAEKVLDALAADVGKALAATGAPN